MNVTESRSRSQEKYVKCYPASAATPFSVKAWNSQCYCNRSDSKSMSVSRGHQAACADLNLFGRRT